MTAFKWKHSKPLGMDSILNFGKHEGEQIEDLIEDDPEYLAWLIEDRQKEFDEEVMQVLTKKRII